MALLHVSHPPNSDLWGWVHPIYIFSNISWTPWVLDPIINPYLGPPSWLHPVIQSCPQNSFSHLKIPSFGNCRWLPHHNPESLAFSRWQSCFRFLPGDPPVGQPQPLVPQSTGLHHCKMGQRVRASLPSVHLYKLPLRAVQGAQTSVLWEGPAPSTNPIFSQARLTGLSQRKE